MATEEEKKKMVQDMLKGIRETDVWTNSLEPDTIIPNCYGLDDLLADESPDFLALAIANHLRRLAGEIEYTRDDKNMKWRLEDLAAQALDVVFKGVSGDVEKAKNLSTWLNNYLQGVLIYRSKLIAASQAA
jgi:hypothetical protein